MYIYKNFAVKVKNTQYVSSAPVKRRRSISIWCPVHTVFLDNKYDMI